MSQSVRLKKAEPMMGTSHQMVKPSMARGLLATQDPFNGRCDEVGPRRTERGSVNQRSVLSIFERINRHGAVIGRIHGAFVPGRVRSKELLGRRWHPDTAAPESGGILVNALDHLHHLLGIGRLRPRDQRGSR